jgi:hypothetical protein
MNVVESNILDCNSIVCFVNKKADKISRQVSICHMLRYARNVYTVVFCYAYVTDRMVTNAWVVLCMITENSVCVFQPGAFRICKEGMRIPVRITPFQSCLDG